MNTFFVDAETDGLYGPFLSVAALVEDGSGYELDRFYGAVRPDGLVIRSEWVREHVLPYLPSAEQFYSSEAELLESFWGFWMKHRDTCRCVADVGVPVEARLFARCVEADLENREFLAPFPLLDLSTLLLSHGLDPLTDRPQLSGLRLTAHDAMNDVKMMAAIWRSLQ